MSYHRTGTIAQLPRDVRDEVNRMLDNGCRYKAVVSWLEANGHPGVKASHIGEWKKGGYQEWLEEHRELAREQKVLEFSYKIATTNEASKAHEAAIRIATNFLFRVFVKFDPDKLASELDMKPTQITSVLNAFSRISRRSNELDMLNDYKRQQEQQRLAASQEKGVGNVPPGLSDQGRAKIEQHYNIRSL